jgi:hypothetical protein
MIDPQVRVRKLGALLKEKPMVRIVEAHNGLTGLIFEQLNHQQNAKNKDWVYLPQQFYAW